MPSESSCESSPSIFSVQEIVLNPADIECGEFHFSVAPCIRDSHKACSFEAQVVQDSISLFDSFFECPNEGFINERMATLVGYPPV